MHGIWLVILAIVLAFYVIGLLGLGWWFSQREHTAEDFLVAGRRLPCWLTTFSLIATWYGAGTLLTVADEVREVGWTAALMDPVGAGLCLALAGWWIAAPLWRMNLLTVGDFFKQRYHRSVEIAAALVLIPSYFGWIAAQFVALAALLNHFFSIPLSLGLLTVAIVGTGYTVLGGMWAVAATDALQLGCVLAGVGMLGWLAVDMTTAADLLEGLQFVPAEGEDPARLTVILDALVIGALGNLCGQDLIQRILSARSPQDARRACQMATIAYLVFGLIPIFLGAVGAAHGMRDGSVVMSLAEHLMHPAALIVFVVAVVSAVLSTIDSAILAPASVMAQNLAPRSWHQRWSSLAVNRCCVVLVAGLSLAIAYAGQDAYELLESAYSLTLVGLLVPFLGGIWSRRGTSGAALASLGLGVTLWVTAEQFGLSDHGTLRLGRWSFPWPGVIGIVGVTAVLYAFLSSLPSLFHDERRRLRSTSSDHPPEGQEA